MMHLRQGTEFHSQRKLWVIIIIITCTVSHLARTSYLSCQPGATECCADDVTLMLHEAGTARLPDAGALPNSAAYTHLSSLFSSDSSIAHTQPPSLFQSDR